MSVMVDWPPELQGYITYNYILTHLFHTEDIVYPIIHNAA